MAQRWSQAPIVVALLCALVLFPMAASASWDGDPELAEPITLGPARPGAPVRIWMTEILDRVWRGVVAVWEQEGVISDPNGAPLPPSGDPAPAPGTQGDAGVISDPNG